MYQLCAQCRIHSEIREYINRGGHIHLKPFELSLRVPYMKLGAFVTRKPKRVVGDRTQFSKHICRKLLKLIKRVGY